jgi:hypothetical protein
MRFDLASSAESRKAITACFGFFLWQSTMFTGKTKPGELELDRALSW